MNKKLENVHVKERKQDFNCGPWRGEQNDLECLNLLREKTENITSTSFWFGTVWSAQKTWPEHIHHFEMFSIQRLERFNMTEVNYQVRSLDGYTNWDGSNKSFHGVWWIGYPPHPKELNQLYFNRYSFLDTAAALLCAAQHRPFSNSSPFNSITCWISDRNLISFYLTE